MGNLQIFKCLIHRGRSKNRRSPHPSLKKLIQSDPILLILFFYIILAPTYAYAQAAGIVITESGYKPTPIGKKVMFFLTPKNMTFDEVKILPKEAFSLSRKPILNFGFNNNNCWIKFKIKNNAVTTDSLISISYGLLDEIELYYFPSSEPDHVTKIKTGDYLQLSTRPIKHRKFLFPVNLYAETQVYIKVKSTGVLTVPIRIWKLYDFIEHDRKITILYSLHYGMMLIIIFYNFFIYLATKDKRFAIYVLHVISTLFVLLGLNGFVNEIWPNFPTWNNQSLGFFLGSYFISLLLFTSSFLKIETFYPKLNQKLNISVLFLGVFTISSLFIPYVKIIKIYAYMGIIIPIFTIILSLSLIKKFKPSLYFSAATFMLLIGTLTVALMDFGLLPNNALVNITPQVGITAEILILSIGLALKINSMKSKIAIRNQELIRLNNLKDNFLVTTTHELKTPLHGIIGLADSIRSGGYGKIPKEVHSTLSIIINSAQRLSILVNDILDVQRLEYKDIKLELQAFDLNKVVSVIDVLSRPLLKNKQVRIINNVPPEKCYVYADMNRTYQVIQNLVSNACKYTYSGIIEISAELQGFATIAVKVMDTGIGVTKRDQERIFEPFEQINPYNTENRGTGLGLSIAKRLIELQSGQITLKSKEGKGSEFSFTLPSASPVELGNYDDTNLIRYCNAVTNFDENKNLQNDTPPGSNFILIIDDELINLKIISNYLQMNNYEVHSCRSGEEALLFLNKRKPDLIILDIMMPGVNGFSICEKVRKKYNQLEVPIIFVTAKNQVTDLVHGYSLGANDYLTKPFVKNELLARVRCQLSITQARDRMVKLRNFANKIHQFKNVDILIKELFYHIAEDEKVNSAAIFQNSRLMKCTSDKQAYVTNFEKWKIEGALPDNYISLDLEEMRNYHLMIELKPESTLLDTEYFKNLKSQAEIIVQNFKRLIGDVYFIDDIHIVANRKKYIKFIKTEDGQTALYEDENDSVIYLKSSLNTLECFFSDILIRVNRFCLINPKKILGIDKSFDQTGKKHKVKVNVDGEIITISDNLLNTFPPVLMKKFLK
jgi:signal transduction histidine kinase/DNA-binding response OmpR family regulator